MIKKTDKNNDHTQKKGHTQINYHYNNSFIAQSSTPSRSSSEVVTLISEQTDESASELMLLVDGLVAMGRRVILDPRLEFSFWSLNRQRTGYFFFSRALMTL